MIVCPQCDHWIDKDKSEAELILEKWKPELTNFLEKMEESKRPYESSPHIYSVLLHDDQLKDMLEIFRSLLKAV